MRSIPAYFRKGVVPEKAVMFYIAQISEALHYLHGLGLIYRDLKPANVMIDKDGHVKLADLGGATDFSADIATARSEKCSIKIVTCQSDEDNPSNSQFAPAYGTATPAMRPEHLESPVKRRTILGTPGYVYIDMFALIVSSLIKYCARYMAPEMIELLYPENPKIFRGGYTYMVDWWSMGCLIYVLLTGQLPYEVGDDEAADLKNIMTQTVDLAGMSDACKDLIMSFLKVDPDERLGFGKFGLRKIQEHPFFESFNWENVVSKRKKPVVVPESMNPDFMKLTEMREPVYKSFSDLPCKGTPIAPEMEQLFSRWDYVSAATLRIEFGIANEMTQYEEKKLKLKRVLGEVGSAASTSSDSSVALAGMRPGMLSAGFTLKNLFSTSRGGTVPPSPLSISTPSSHFLHKDISILLNKYDESDDDKNSVSSVRSYGLATETNSKH